MTNLSPAQSLVLDSLLRNVLGKATPSFQVTIEQKDKSAPLLCLIRENGSSDTLTMTIGPETGRQVPLQEVAALLVQTMESREDNIILRDGENATKLGFKGNSVTRETVKPAKPVLKTASWAVGKSTHLDPEEAAPLLQTIGLMTADGEIKAAMRRKFKQVNHFLDQVSPLLKLRSPKKPFRVIDCGCGKTYLGFVLFWYISRKLKYPANFYGVDVSEKLIQQNQQRAKELGIDNMQFVCSTIRDANLPKNPDLLVSLHACDTATDEALAAGIGAGAQHIVAVPCCQHELAGQIEEVPHYPLSSRHGIFTHRFGDLLTDMMRALFLEAHGYAVTAGEFVSPIETPKNLMLRASRGNPLAEKRQQEYEKFKQFYKIRPAIDQFYLEREAIAKR